MKKIIVGIIISIGLNGCQVAVPTIINTDKSDGVVILGYQDDPLINVTVDKKTAQERANQQCKLWNYNNAQSINEGVEKCTHKNVFGNCVMSQIELTYQCMK